MQQSGEIKSTDKLFFPKEIVFRKHNEGWLVVAVSTANWLVLPSGFQRQLLEHLINGETIGEVCQLISSEQQLTELKQLLAAITARSFAYTDHVPEPQFPDVTHQLTCYLTNACNLRCQHCFMRSGKPMDNELSKEEWNRILTDFRQQGGESVTFTGGEPLMNHDFHDILKHAHHQGLTTTILSNGILWTESLIHDLAPFISEIQISIDGFDEASNAKVRGSGHFDRIVRNVILFANAGVRTSVATTFTFQNLQSDAAQRYQQMVNTIRSQCQHPVFFKLSKKILPGRNTNYTEEQNREFYNRVMEIEHAVDPEAQYTNFMEGHTPNSITRNCGFGGISIAANGEVFYCNRLSELESYGNIRNKSILPFMQQGMQVHLQTSVDHLQPCQSCHLRYICCGGCRIEECNFQGKLQHHQGPFLQTRCDEAYIQRLEQKMILSYLQHYQF